MATVPEDQQRRQGFGEDAAVQMGLLGAMVGIGWDLVSTPTWQRVGPSCLGYGLLGFVAGYALVVALVVFCGLPGRDDA